MALKNVPGQLTRAMRKLIDRTTSTVRRKNVRTKNRKPGGGSRSPS